MPTYSTSYASTPTAHPRPTPHLSRAPRALVGSGPTHNSATHTPAHCTTALNPNPSLAGGQDPHCECTAVHCIVHLIETSQLTPGVLCPTPLTCLTLPVLHTVAAVHNVAANLDCKVTTDGAGLSCQGVGGANQFAGACNDTVALPHLHRGNSRSSIHTSQESKP
jgi:hypothetical protein